MKAANQNPRDHRRFTLRATGEDATTDDGTPREMHFHDIGDARCIGILSCFSCEILDHVTGTIEVIR